MTIEPRTRPIYVCAVTHSHVCRDLFVREGKCILHYVLESDDKALLCYGCVHTTRSCRSLSTKEPLIRVPFALRLGERRQEGPKRDGRTLLLFLVVTDVCERKRMRERERKRENKKMNERTHERENARENVREDPERDGRALLLLLVVTDVCVYI